MVEQFVTCHMSSRLLINLCYLSIFHVTTRRMQLVFVNPIVQIVNILCGTKSVSRHHIIKEDILKASNTRLYCNYEVIHFLTSQHEKDKNAIHAHY